MVTDRDDLRDLVKTACRCFDDRVCDGVTFHVTPEEAVVVGELLMDRPDLPYKISWPGEARLTPYKPS